jgi:hypothetical protein
MLQVAVGPEQYVNELLRKVFKKMAGFFGNFLCPFFQTLDCGNNSCRSFGRERERERERKLTTAEYV